MSSLIYKIHPYHYLHVLDTNSNKTRLEIGPQTYLKQENEKIIFGPEKMITIPPRHYCVIENPVVKLKYKGNEVELDENGIAKLAFADLEIRFSCQPFPLYPGEILKQNITPLKIISANSALRLKAILDFEDQNSVKRIAGDEWLFEGPGTYIPRKEVSVEEQINALVIKPNQAIKLRARKEFSDRNGIKRVTGEEWIVKQTGAYLPNAFESIIGLVDAYVLTEKRALHLRANCTFIDDFNKKRLNGEEWLITCADTDTYIPNVYEEVVNVVMVTTLNSRQYTVILDPVDSTGKSQMGKKRLVKGEKCFFLQPGEKLENGIQDIYVLMADEGLILKCIDYFEDELKVRRVPGDRWIIKGPTEYVPPVECEIVSKRKAIPLGENEGVYVRSIKSGKKRAVIGETYMLNEDEELWEKQMPANIEKIVLKDSFAERNSKNDENLRKKWQVIEYRVPHNGAVQIYDYKQKKSRVVFGPELVMLNPDEQFNMISFSFFYTIVFLIIVCNLRNFFVKILKFLRII